MAPDVRVRILDKSGQLLTVLEFISPWNKRQPGLDEFRERRAKLFAGGVHVVEVDLVRAGNWRALMRLDPPLSVEDEAWARQRVAGNVARD